MSQSVSRELRCPSCRYIVKGVPRDGDCPECGLPISEVIAKQGDLAVAEGWARGALWFFIWSFIGFVVLYGALFVIGALLAVLARSHLTGTVLQWLLWRCVGERCGFQTQLHAAAALVAIAAIGTSTALLSYHAGTLPFFTTLFMVFGTPIVAGGFIIRDCLIEQLP